MRITERLWFDVEERYNTTRSEKLSGNDWLWFDVEERYNTTVIGKCTFANMLWFDVEERYNTTVAVALPPAVCCGLM